MLCPERKAHHAFGNHGYHDGERRFYEALAKKQRFFSLAYLTKQEDIYMGIEKGSASINIYLVVEKLEMKRRNIGGYARSCRFNAVKSPRRDKLEGNKMNLKGEENGGGAGTRGAGYNERRSTTSG